MIYLWMRVMAPRRKTTSSSSASSMRYNNRDTSISKQIRIEFQISAPMMKMLSLLSLVIHLFPKINRVLLKAIGRTLCSFVFAGVLLTSMSSRFQWKRLQRAQYSSQSQLDWLKLEAEWNVLLFDLFPFCFKCLVNRDWNISSSCFVLAVLIDMKFDGLVLFRASFVSVRVFVLFAPLCKAFIWFDFRAFVPDFSWTNGCKCRPGINNE